MVKSYHFVCPKCNNSQNFYCYGKDSDGYQKYQCRGCNHDYDYYTNYRCTNKHCNHSFCVVKGAAVAESSMSTLFGKTSFKRMRYPVFVIITALSMFYLGKSSLSNISLILRTAFNIRVSHTTISNWCTNFAPLFDNMRIKLLPMLDLSSDEWHMDETVVKVAGKKHYLWLIVDS